MLLDLAVLLTKKFTSGISTGFALRRVESQYLRQFDYAVLQRDKRDKKEPGKRSPARSVFVR